MDEQRMSAVLDREIAHRKRPVTFAQSPRRKSGSRTILDAGLIASLADPSRVVFLDVETTGLSWYYDRITVLGWMCDSIYDFHIAGETPIRLSRALQNAA